MQDDLESEPTLAEIEEEDWLKAANGNAWSNHHLKKPGQ